MILTVISHTDSEDPSASDAASVPMCACCFKTEDFPVPVLPLGSVGEGVAAADGTGGEVGAGVSTAQKSRAVGSAPSYAS
jgi:hypothetical protein